MIRVDIDETRLGRLFPAFLLVDAAGTILSTGPALRRHMPELALAARLAEQFRIEAGDGTVPLAALADSGQLVQLVALQSGMRLSGSVIALDRGYLFAMRYVPSQFALGAENLQMSDFGPDDPMVPGLLLVGLQKALLEESRSIAAELSRERQRSLELLERISRTAGFMAHDFNNFLSIIRLNADRIDNDGSGGDGPASRNRRLAGIISETAERASEITRSLMTLSRQRFDSRLPLDVDGLISENAAFFRTLLGPANALDLALDAAGARVEASRVALLNSVMNLLINARDAMPDGGRVSISTGIRQAQLAPHGRPADPSPRDYLAILISDTGTGMTPEVLDRAFEALFSTKPHGNGIGLASVLDFARDMGGEACIDSLPGEGTRLFIYLPVMVQPVACAAAGAPASATPATTGGAAGGRPRVLLVEDEPYALEALAEMLEDEGLAVQGCANADEGRAALGEGRFDLLLTDIVLPGDSGLVFAEEACVRDPEMAVIVMSGYVPEGEAIRPSWLFLRKPINSGVLKDLIQAALASRPRASPRDIAGT